MVHAIDKLEALLRRTWAGFDLPLAAAGPSRFGPCDALLASARVTDGVRLEVRCARALADRLAASVFAGMGPATEEDLGTMLIHVADALADCVDRGALDGLLSSGVVAPQGELVRRCFTSDDELIVIALIANRPAHAGWNMARRTG